MELIDKDALVAEIEKLKGKVDDHDDYANGWHNALSSVETDINFLEVKEVDLEKALVVYHNENFSPCNDGTLISCETGSELTWNDYERIAKHFFELGLKAQKGEEV